MKKSLTASTDDDAGALQQPPRVTTAMVMAPADSTSDVLDERAAPTYTEGDKDKCGSAAERALLMKSRRLRAFRDVLQKLDRDRELHDVERVRLG